jgi:SAM-dependent methyltransferase
MRLDPDLAIERSVRDREAHSYDAFQTALRSRWFVWARDTVARHWLRREARILDAGCGTGSFLARLAGGDRPRAVGCDLSVESLKVVRSRRTGAALLCADLTRLPFGSLSFDGVALLGVLQSIPLPLQEAVLRELARVARKGARLTVQVYNARTAPTFDRKVGAGRFRSGMFYYTFGVDELEGLLARAGWRIVRVRGFGVLHYLSCRIRGGFRIYKLLARVVVPLEGAVTLWGGARSARYGEYLYALCVRDGSE